MGEEENKKERRFSQKQYDFLKQCAEKGKEGIKEWNEWRERHPDEEIWLQGGRFQGWFLKGAFLATEVIPGIHKEVHLENTYFAGAHLENADLSFACMEKANLGRAHLEGARLFNSYLRGAHLNGAHLKNANLRFVDLEDAKLLLVHLEGADLTGQPNLRGANFLAARVNSSTLIWKCKVSRYCKKACYTDFSAVGLDEASIDPGTKQLLEYNIRRKNWEDWYKEGRWWQCILKRLFIWPFWLISDYGLSTKRVIGVFFLLALLFAVVYMYWGYSSPPGIVSNLVVQPVEGEADLHYLTRAMVRPIYFSVVTMTTLGFGDMYANKGSIWGHILLILQVILGYVLLGALITRFAVLFTAGGPAGKFAEEDKDGRGRKKGRR